MGTSGFDTEIHLRHQRVEDALYKLEKYLDEAFINCVSQVRIIHGKGTGTLSKAVRAFLDSHPLVKSFHFADYGDGDYGVTITEMEKRGGIIH